MVRPGFTEAASMGAARCHDGGMGTKRRTVVQNGPLQSEIFALDEHDHVVDISFMLADGRVAVYRTSVTSDIHAGPSTTLRFVGIDPFA